jgi:hypothetical protein
MISSATIRDFGDQPSDTDTPGTAVGGIGHVVHYRLGCEATGEPAEPPPLTGDEMDEVGW